MKWLSTRSAYLIIVPLLAAGSIATIWLSPEARLKAGTVLLGLVITRYVARWLHQYSDLFVSPKEGLTRVEKLERRLIWLFESHLDDTNAMGVSHKPVHIKLAEIDLQHLQAQRPSVLTPPQGGA